MPDHPEFPFERRHREQAQKERDIEKRSQERAKEAQDGERLTALFRNLTHEVTNQIDASCGEQRAESQKRNRLDVSQICLLIVTAGLTFLTYRVFYKQLGEMRQQRIDTQSQSDRQHSDTVKALDISEDVERQQLRAYVGLHRSEGPNGHVLQILCPDCGGGPSNAPTPGGGLRNRLVYQLKNFGLTPAYRPGVCMTVVSVPIDSDLTTDEAMQSLTDCGAGKMTQPTIWPGEERPYFKPLSPKDIEKIRASHAGQQDVFFVGFIEYADAWKKKHQSWICYVRLRKVEPAEGVGACGNTLAEDN